MNMRNTTKGWLCVSGGMINLSLSYFSYTLVILFLPLLAEQLGCSLAPGVSDFYYVSDCQHGSEYVLGAYCGGPQP